MRLLVGENDAALGTFLQRGFEAEQYAADLAHGGEETQAMARKGEYHLAVIDLNLSKPGGLEVLQNIRAERQHLPILVLTSKNHDSPRVQVLNGAGCGG